MKGKTMVFVYGTLLKGERNDHWIDEKTKREDGYTYGRLWDTGWGYPTIEIMPDMTVGGEVVHTDDAGLARMDVLEGYPSLYDRKLVRVRVGGGRWVDAWVYYMRKIPNGAVVMNCDWKRRDRSKSSDNVIY